MASEDKVPISAVQSVMITLYDLFSKAGSEGLTLLYDLLQASSDSSYQMSRQAALRLLRLKLVLKLQLQPNDEATVTVHDDVVAIVVAAIRVDRQSGTVSLRSFNDVAREIGT